MSLPWARWAPWSCSDCPVMGVSAGPQGYRGRMAGVLSGERLGLRLARGTGDGGPPALCLQGGTPAHKPAGLHPAGARHF